MLEGNSSSEVGRVPHLRQYDRMLHQIDVLIRVEVGWVAELLCERCRRQQMLQDINVVVLKLGCLKKGFYATLELLVELADDRVGAWVVVIDRFLGAVELGGWVDGGNGESTHCGLLNLLKEVSLLGSENPHAVALIQEEDAIGASTEHHALLIDGTDNYELVEDADDWAVIAGPAKLTSVCLLGFFVIDDHPHICLHDDDSTSVLGVGVHGNEILFGIQSDKLDLAKGVRILILLLLYIVVVMVG